MGLLLLIAAAIVLLWPYRRERRWIVRRLIAAPREFIWDAYHPGSEGPTHDTFHPKIIANKLVSTAPMIWEQTVDDSGGHGTNFATGLLEGLTVHRPALVALRVREISGDAYPYGKSHCETFQPKEHAGGTLASLVFQGETASLGHNFSLWLSRRKYLRRLQHFCESGGVAAVEPKRRTLWMSVAFSGLAIGSFSLLLGWIMGLLVAGILVVHEFGHWLAMRLTGQPAPRVLLVPFFGGVAIPNQPHKTLFNDAFCSLMGPAFSVLPAFALILTAWALGVPDTAAFQEHAAEFRKTFDHSVYPWEIRLGIDAVSLATIVCALNLLQLVPVLPLDGGQVLRALLQSFGAKWARWGLLSLTSLGIAGLCFIHYYILAGILVLGALQGWYMTREAPKARPMSAAGAIVICLSYGLTIAAYWGVARAGFPVFIY